MRTIPCNCIRSGLQQQQFRTVRTCHDSLLIHPSSDKKTFSTFCNMFLASRYIYHTFQQFDIRSSKCFVWFIFYPAYCHMEQLNCCLFWVTYFILYIFIDLANTITKVLWVQISHITNTSNLLSTCTLLWNCQMIRPLTRFDSWHLPFICWQDTFESWLLSPLRYCVTLLPLVWKWTVWFCADWLSDGLDILNIFHKQVND